MIPNDPFMLLSYINMKLRDEFDNLDDLCNGLDIDKSEVLDKLRNAGFEYIPSLNQFK